MFDKLFTYETLFEAAPDAYGFGDCTLLQTIGALEKGSAVRSIWFNPETAKLTFYQGEDGGKIVHTCSAFLQVETC